MFTRRNVLSAWAAGVAGLALGTPARRLRAEPRARLAIVVSKASSLTELSSAQLARAYQGDLVDVAGRRLIPLNRGLSTPERVGFDRAILKMSPDEVGRYWIDRRIRGQSGAPRIIDPSDVYQRVIAKLQGSVGYALLQELREDVKVLRIDGKLPNDPGYPIEY